MRLVYDIERTDRYGRTLAYLHRRSDGLFVNLALVREGFAQVATFPPNVAHVEEFVAAQREAREASRGLWGACPAGATTTTTASAGQTPAGSEPYYASCAEARRAGAAPLHRGEPGYRSGLDRDNDGVACE